MQNPEYGIFRWLRKSARVLIRNCEKFRMQAIKQTVLVVFRGIGTGVKCTYITYTLCLKKHIPDVISYNSRKHYQIFVIFGRNI